MSQEKFDNNKKIESRSAEEMKIYTAIEIGVMKRSNLEPIRWAEHYAEDFEYLFKANKEQFLELYKKDPEELYALIRVTLEIEDGD